MPPCGFNRRSIVVASMCLLLGVIINILVAWGCVCWSPQTQLESVEPEVMRWRAPAPADWPAISNHWAFAAFGLTEYESQTVDPVVGMECVQWVLQPGWPLRSMYVARSHRSRGLGAGVAYVAILLSGDQPGSWRDGLIIPDWAQREYGLTTRYLPTQVLWTGFTVDSALYAWLLWIAFSTTSKMRRRLRISRGLCPVCRYPIGSSAVCTECGVGLGVKVGARESE